VGLAGTRALVTGAGQRLGRSIAQALGASGVSVCVHYRRSEQGAEKTVQVIKDAGGNAFALKADLYKRMEARRLVDDAVQRLGGLDLLVLSAANFDRVPFDSMEDKAIDRALQLNVVASMLIAQRAAPALRESNGSIVMITCASVEVPFRNYLPYVVSKAAAHQLMRGLAMELAPDVRVNAVAPGTVLPPPDMSQDDLERIERTIPLRRIGGPEDVVDAVLYLAQARFVTGQQLLVDGGRSVARPATYG
jgi:pteridine reductase